MSVCEDSHFISEKQEREHAQSMHNKSGCSDEKEIPLRFKSIPDFTLMTNRIKHYIVVVTTHQGQNHPSNQMYLEHLTAAFCVLNYWLNFFP